MLRRIPVLIGLLALIVGCGLSPQQQYDSAVKAFDRAQARLDLLRPAYDAAREQAKLAVCKEIAGATLEESALGALGQLEAAKTDALAGLATDAAATGEAKPATDPDAVLDQLIGAHEKMAEQHSALTGSLAKVQETMTKINTPGTPEAARVDEMLSKLPEAQAYLRQEKRVARAQEAVDSAEAALAAAEAK